ncbi:MAG: GDSL-type esterase/lipase family protein [Verrucomicrobiales bacterium]|nr:GDSL-type esterase/lipase family protein [Verrucomicrobiales bacterium]
MKKFLLTSVVALVSVVAVNAQNNPKVWPMPAELPFRPAGVKVTVFPYPRAEWVERVKRSNDAAQTQNRTQSIKLVFDGDSITDGWHGGGQKIWQERYAKYGAFNFGIGGDRTENVLWRLSQGQMSSLQPKLVAIMIGTNNIGNSAEDIIDGVTAIVAEYRKLCPDAVILLQAIFPRNEKADHPWRAKIKEVNAAIAKLDDGDKVVFVDFSDKFLQPDGTLGKDIMPDFLHPNASGYQIWADAIQPYIDKYLQ